MLIIRFFVQLCIILQVPYQSHKHKYNLSILFFSLKSLNNYLNQWNNLPHAVKITQNGITFSPLEKAIRLAAAHTLYRKLRVKYVG
jgi:hypothetical protein